MRTTFNQITELLRGQDDIVILTHKRPDGDTLGSAAALCRGLRQLGKTAHLWPNPDLTPRFEALTEGLWAKEDTKAAYVCAVDIADRALLPQNAAERFVDIDMAIDHHPSFKDYGAVGYCRPEAAGCGEIIYDLLMALGCTLDKPMADAVYTAIATDTGCFCFSNTTAYTHTVAAACMAAGADAANINYVNFRLKTRARVALEGHIYSDMQMVRGGRGSAVLLTRDYIEGLQASDDDCDNLASLLTQIDGVEIGALLTEVKTRDAFKVSMRGRGHDVSAVCGKFGGGGHAGAAGCTLTGMDGAAALAAIIQALEEELDA